MAFRTHHGLICLATLAACTPAKPHPYPAETAAGFFEKCPQTDAFCACSWDEITRRMTADEYESAMARFDAEGLMDPRLTEARLTCKSKQ